VFARTTRVTIAATFAAWRFFVCISDVLVGAQRPRAIAINAGLPGGSFQLAEIMTLSDWKEVGINWLDRDTSVASFVPLLVNPAAAAFRASAAQTRAALVESAAALQAVIEAASTGDT
jgi:hypothetical protein